METLKLMIELPKEVYEVMKNNVSLNSDQKGIAESIVVHSILSGTILNEYKVDDNYCKECVTCSLDDGECCRKIFEEQMASDLSECKSDDVTFKDDNAVSRLSVRDIIYANAYELEYPDSSSEYVVNRDELIKYLMELPTTKENLADAENCISREYLRKSMIEYGWSHPDSTVTEYVESLPSAYPKSDKPYDVVINYCAEHGQILIDKDKLQQLRKANNQLKKQIKMLKLDRDCDKPSGKCENCRYYGAETSSEPFENYHLCYQSTSLQNQYVKSDDWCDRFTNASWVNGKQG